VIETERLSLRRFTEADRDTVARWNADRDFTRHLAGVQTREQSDEQFDRWARHWEERGFGLLAIEWQETGELIGRVGPGGSASSAMRGSSRSRPSRTSPRAT
jgi:RimJ/RimL family protein N-acetyltransferase